MLCLRVLGLLHLIVLHAVGHALRSGPPRRFGETELSSVELVPSVEELEVLCETVGLVSACRAPKLLMSRMNADILVRADGKLPSCLPPGRLVFVHVMKTGGLSIDAVLQQACLADPKAQCSIRRHDGTRGLDGNRQCTQPSMCTSHDPMLNDLEVCGGAFKNATYFTVLRDPISRVWSFYNYISRWYEPYQKMPLGEVYEAMVNNVDLNEGLPEDGKCFHCLTQLQNAMAERSFQEIEGSSESWKQQLKSLHMIIDISSLDRFPELASKAALFPELPALNAEYSQLSVPHENSPKPRWGDKPDSKTEKIIRKYNQRDVYLYEFAKTLPNFMS
mmetsp:Transcript_46200/g.100395  ORF Transcript_46200/g.100395 Transcript_46200/m.100395 type:complete len:333 (+) Transcript_46200:52-1050(+)|eukprot:CAMPEP_0170596094 /NCGR_PEP_ID=MMETSP0224-20130122/14921_1 /TAXON_ID=285029 /ORGANISM="Togula jolla, Strain CCCM 725" /LENGTH=332 /DNA_ID=CAMNT_0010920337 /DNA_START=47 /DNA_END=1045 /DNA_ORIENTATION=-